MEGKLGGLEAGRPGSWEAGRLGGRELGSWKGGMLEGWETWVVFKPPSFSACLLARLGHI
jgi:hypothetical protein